MNKKASVVIVQNNLWATGVREILSETLIDIIWLETVSLIQRTIDIQITREKSVFAVWSAIPILFKFL